METSGIVGRNRRFRVAPTIVLVGCAIGVLVTVMIVSRGRGIDSNGSVGLSRHSPVASAIELQAAQDGAILDLSKMTAFQWDRLWIFGPYTSDKDIEKTLGFAWSGASDSNINETDGIVLFVFVKDRRVVHAFEQSRTTDFGAAVRAEGMTPEEAKFVVRHRTMGQPRVAYFISVSTRSTQPSK